MADREYLKKYLKADGRGPGDPASAGLAAGRSIKSIDQESRGASMQRNGAASEHHAPLGLNHARHSVLPEPQEWTLQSDNPVSSHQSARAPGSDTVYRDATGRRIDLTQKHRELGGRQTGKIDRDRYVGDIGVVRRAALTEDPVIGADVTRSPHVHSNARDKVIEPTCQRFRTARGSNRFNIAPGLSWDGVDRSNGYERRRLGFIAGTADSRCQNEAQTREDL